MTTIIQGESRKASLWEYFAFLVLATCWWVFIRPIEKAINRTGLEPESQRTLKEKLDSIEFHEVHNDNKP